MRWLRRVQHEYPDRTGWLRQPCTGPDTAAAGTEPCTAAGRSLDRNTDTQMLLRERGIAGVTGNFEQFLAMDMDVVYIASPTGCHFGTRPQYCVLAGTPGLKSRWQAVSRMSGIGGSGRTWQLHARRGFMFPWHAQAAAIRQTLTQNRRCATEVVLTFCFPHLQPDNVRYDPALGAAPFWITPAIW